MLGGGLAPSQKVSRQEAPPHPPQPIDLLGRQRGRVSISEVAEVTVGSRFNFVMSPPTPPQWERPIGGGRNIINSATFRSEFPHKRQ